MSGAQGVRPAQPGSVTHLGFRVNDGAARWGREGRVVAAGHGCGVGSQTRVGVRPPPASCVAPRKAPGRPLSSSCKESAVRLRPCGLGASSLRQHLVCPEDAGAPVLP